MTFLDTNVLLDVVYSDASWKDWSLEAILAADGPLRIAPTVYAELSGRYEEREELDEDIGLLGLTVEEPTRSALFEAGRAHALYRHRGGTRSRVLPDFLIGAQARERGAVLITRGATAQRSPVSGSWRRRPNRTGWRRSIPSPSGRSPRP